MARQKLANGTWIDLGGPPDLPAHPPGPIVRSSVPVELEELPVTTEAHSPEPTDRQRQAWDLVERLGSQTAAARTLGITQAGVQTLLGGYMHRRGIKGPLPGKLPVRELSPQLSTTEEPSPWPPAQSHEKHWLGNYFAEGCAECDQALIDAREPEPASEVLPSANVAVDQPIKTVAEANDRAAQLLAEYARDLPTSGIEDQAERVYQRAAAYVELSPLLGETAPRIHPWLGGAIVWLEEHGPTWNQGQAEKWLVAFTRILDLVYPPGA